MSSKRYTTSEQAILTTILYSDIFSFPLTKDELWKFLISRKKIPRREFEKSLHALKNVVIYKNGYYCLSDREEIVSKRIQNFPEAEKKMSLALSAVEKLCRIPSILFIGISGGLAVGNVTEKDDIDFVIITKRNTLFLSRLLVLSLLESQGVRRSRNQKNAANTICVNLLFDETALDWFGNHKDIYTAREIVQILPLFERENIYRKFLNTNRWIEQYLPNVRNSGQVDVKIIARKNSDLFDLLVLNPFVEFLTRFLQMSLMMRHRSIETISNKVLAFHPIDYRAKTLRRLRLKMRQLGLLTKI